jgi:hypothetical protein
MDITLFTHVATKKLTKIFGHQACGSMGPHIEKMATCGLAIYIKEYLTSKE